MKKETFEFGFHFQTYEFILRRLKYVLILFVCSAKVELDRSSLVTF